MLDFRHTDREINRFAENISHDYSWVRAPIPPKFNSFTERLQWWLEERGYGAKDPATGGFAIKRGTQGPLARKLGMGQGSLSELIAGTRASKGPSAPVLLKLCEELHLRPHYLLNGDGPPESYSDLSADESRLIMVFRELPKEDLRKALLIDAADMLQRNNAGPSSPDPAREKLKAKTMADRSKPKQLKKGNH